MRDQPSKTAGAEHGRWWSRSAAVLGLLAFTACEGPEIARLEIGDIGRTVEKNVALRPGQELAFGYVTGPYEYVGDDQLIVEVALLREGAVVGQVKPTLPMHAGFEQRTSGRTRYNSEWKLKVPAEGATAIRATARLAKGTAKATFGHLAVLVHDEQ